MKVNTITTDCKKDNHFSLQIDFQRSLHIVFFHSSDIIEQRKVNNERIVGEPVLTG
jgi:hypothetical protein